MRYKPRTHESRLTTMRPWLLLRYFHPRKMWGYVGIWYSPNTLKFPQILFPKNTLPWWRVFNLAKNTLEWRGFVGISWNYPLKTRTSKQPIGEIPGYEIIPFHPLKYPRSKQGLMGENWETLVCVYVNMCRVVMLGVTKTSTERLAQQREFRIQTTMWSSWVQLQTRKA
jgi:hypothetical protein